MVFPHLINQTTRQSDLCFSQKVNKESSEDEYILRVLANIVFRQSVHD